MKVGVAARSRGERKKGWAWPRGVTVNKKRVGVAVNEKKGGCGHAESCTDPDVGAQVWLSREQCIKVQKNT
jgi:hypothetical protein